ncbi:hypothetical protein B0H14DRAFT_2622941 [Mycena olivaceomarginata]|nr:hypothetical protein B0H14DRAFT_2622941 [Mycena olivaceomarginata]
MPRDQTSPISAERVRKAKTYRLRRQYLSEMLKELKQKDLQLLQDVHTRWLSLLMIDGAILLLESEVREARKKNIQFLAKAKVSGVAAERKRKSRANIRAAKIANRWEPSARGRKRNIITRGARWKYPEPRHNFDLKLRPLEPISMPRKAGHWPDLSCPGSDSTLQSTVLPIGLLTVTVHDSYTGSVIRHPYRPVAPLALQFDGTAYAP